MKISKKRYYGAIDQGTTSTRFIVFDEKFNIKSISQKEHKQIYPKPGYVEHNPTEILKNTKFTIRQALKKAKIKGSDLVSVGITNQRETFVIWNPKTGKPYMNAVVWQDTRSKDILKEYHNKKNYISNITGLPVSTYFSATKLKFILDNNPKLRKKVKKKKLLFGTIDSYLIWNLTDNHYTDTTNASRTLLMNLKNLEWDLRLTKLFNIPKSILPKIKHSISDFGYCSEFGFSINAILGDQQAALFGQTCFEEGEIKNTYGTGCFTLLNTGKKIVKSKYGLISTVAFSSTNEKFYALEGSVGVAGSLLQWLRDNLGIVKSAQEVDILASKVQDNGGVYIVPAFTGLFAPYWKPEARGIISGLTNYANKNHICKASIEAVAFQTKELILAMEKESKVKIIDLKVDGGMVKSKTLMQFQADILNKNIICPKNLETTALGVALASAYSIGVFENLDEIRKTYKKQKIFKPKMDYDRAYNLYKNWKRTLMLTY